MEYATPAERNLDDPDVVYLHFSDVCAEGSAVQRMAGTHHEVCCRTAR